jgi:hypothetical protein
MTEAAARGTGPRRRGRASTARHRRPDFFFFIPSLFRARACAPPSGARGPLSGFHFGLWKNLICFWKTAPHSAPLDVLDQKQDAPPSRARRRRSFSRKTKEGEIEDFFFHFSERIERSYVCRPRFVCIFVCVNRMINGKGPPKTTTPFF